MTEPPDDRSPLALAMEWTSRVTAVSLEMVLPCVLGYWVDRQLNTRMVFLVLGAVFGLVCGMWHLIRMTQSPAADRGRRRESAKKEQKS